MLPLQSPESLPWAVFILRSFELCGGCQMRILCQSLSLLKGLIPTQV
jgi:hypothetical protein